MDLLSLFVLPISIAIIAISFSVFALMIGVAVTIVRSSECRKLIEKKENISNVMNDFPKVEQNISSVGTRKYPNM